MPAISFYIAAIIVSKIIRSNIKQRAKMQTCCSKVICKGCFYANDLRQIEQSLDRTCPFCRHPTVTATEEEENKMILKRVEANDPVAIAQVGREHCVRGEFGTAFEYLTKAVELGDVNARYNLSLLYRKGGGVEKHMEKEQDRQRHLLR